MADCNGDCCVAFRVPFTLVDLAEGNVGDMDVEEARMLADMLEPLTLAETRLRQLDFIRGVIPVFDESDEGFLYKCKNWDEETRLCTIYEDRPPMCRDFPYGKPCRYGCECVGEEPAPEVII